jgi:flagellar biosynthesis chaperone FliJ
VSRTQTELRYELATLEQKHSTLTVAVERCANQLQNGENRLESLESLVDKQAEHLQALRGAEVVSLLDFKDMRLKHHQHRRNIDETRLVVTKIRNDLAKKRTELTTMNEEMELLRKELNRWGTTTVLRKTS